jgi:deferrochelatase/peroxidase EfeB
VARIALTNIQGVLDHFYPFPCSRYLLFRMEDGRKFLRVLRPLLTPADPKNPPGRKRCLNIGLTFEGLKALGLPAAVLDEFPDDFKQGPDPAVMGDFGENVPSRWWSGRFTTAEIHALVQVSACDKAEMGAFTEDVRELVHELATELLPRADAEPLDGEHLGGGRLHFGYRDGLSHPSIAWDDAAATTSSVDFRNFILGYSTPEISSTPKEVASRPASRDATLLVRDGSYAVFRWLYQDVAGFNRFLATEGSKVSPALPPRDAEELLAAKLLGRWRDGTPIVLSPDRPDPSLSTSNDFLYNAVDPNGTRCPFAAHIRVVNPRDQELGFAEFGVVPQVIRRGTPFGPPLEGVVDDGQQRGLIGMFLCSSIGAQVYKLMTWMKRTDFSPKFSDPVGQDPFSSRLVPLASDLFDVPGATATTALKLPDFTRTLGTAFFLMPSLESVRRISEEP